MMIDPLSSVGTMKLIFVLLLLCELIYAYNWLPFRGTHLTRSLRSGIQFHNQHVHFVQDLSDNDAPNANGKISSSNDLDQQRNPILKRWYRLTEETRGEIRTSIVTFGIALLVRLLVVEPRFIPSLSMFPTFDIGDQLLVDKVTHIRKPYQRRDVVVFNPTAVYKEMTGNNEALIKRVVAIAGDTVEVKNNRLFVNGIVQEETYVNDYPEYALPLTKVPAGMLLVLGDNRNHSFDSHVWGFLPEKNVIGRAFVKYWPPWRAGIVEGSL